MSELGQSRQIGRVPVTSGLPRTTDIIRTSRHVSNVPTAGMLLGRSNWRSARPTQEISGRRL